MIISNASEVNRSGQQLPYVLALTKLFTMKKVFLATNEEVSYAFHQANSEKLYTRPTVTIIKKQPFTN